MKSRAINGCFSGLARQSGWASAGPRLEGPNSSDSLGTWRYIRPAPMGCTRLDESTPVLLSCDGDRQGGKLEQRYTFKAGGWGRERSITLQAKAARVGGKVSRKQSGT